MRGWVKPDGLRLLCSIIMIPACGWAGHSVRAEQGAGNAARGVSRAENLDHVNDTLGLSHSVVSALKLPTAGSDVSLAIPIAGRTRIIDLQPHSVRAAGYQVQVQLPDGSLVAVEPSPERTWRGRVRGVPGSAVAASLQDEGLFAWITLPQAGRYLVQPLAPLVSGANRREHVIYHEQDVVAPELGDVVLPNPEGAFEALNLRAAKTLACGTGLCEAELACDADADFHEYWGSVAAVEDRINAVINAVNVQYERDVSIRHVLTAIIVRTSEPDPYTAIDAYDLLLEFRSHWTANHADIPRDMAQLFTAKDITYGGSDLIGLAWMNSVCGSLAYSVVQQYGGIGLAADLSAHELGHNWSADHCGCGNPPFTMNPYITGANVFNPTESIPQVIAFRDSRTCLEGASSECSGDPECDDGDACNGAEYCAGGSCQPGTPPDCQDGDACTADLCDPVSGACTYEAVDCDDGNACTTDGCDPAAGCTNTQIDCDDNNLCTSDGCDAGTGCFNDQVSCNDANPCTSDGCDPSQGCVYAPLSQCCGNAACEEGEDCDACPDDCVTGGGGCGNGVCEISLGEDCLSCPADCNGKQNGRPAKRYCCGDGDGTNPVNCSDPRCTQGEYQCAADVLTNCCGDGLCEGQEDSFSCEIDCGPPPECGDALCEPPEACSCPDDCGTPPAAELSCSDGQDDDCDGAADCNDADCQADDICNVCIPTHSKEKGPRCSDGIDNDCDGAADCDDADCGC